MTAGKHVADEPNWWQRRSRAGKTGIVTAILLAISGIAIALFIFQSGTTGSVTGANYEVVLTGVNVQPTDTNCVITTPVDAVNFDLQWSDPVPDDVCDPSIRYKAPATNSGDLVLQSYTPPDGLTATISSKCGATLIAGDTNGQLIPLVLTFDGSVSDITFDPAIHGFQWVRPADYVAANCNSTS